MYWRWILLEHSPAFPDFNYWWCPSAAAHTSFTVSLRCSSNQRDSTRIASPFFENHQLVSSWLKPWAREMIPKTKAFKIKSTASVSTKNTCQTNRKRFTIFVRDPHNCLSIFSHCRFQHNCRHRNWHHLLYLQASGAQYFHHLPTFVLSPCYSYLKPTGHFLLEHWKLPAKII